MQLNIPAQLTQQSSLSLTMPRVATAVLVMPGNGTNNARLAWKDGWQKAGMVVWGHDAPMAVQVVVVVGGDAEASTQEQTLLRREAG